MATLHEPTTEQLLDARDALRRLVLPYRYDGEAPALWRSAHATLCKLEEALSLEYTLPPRDERRNGKRKVEPGDGDESTG
jgi:hypothetical protein